MLAKHILEQDFPPKVLPQISVHFVVISSRVPSVGLSDPCEGSPPFFGWISASSGAKCLSLLHSVRRTFALQSLAKFSQEAIQRKQTPFSFTIFVLSASVLARKTLHCLRECGLEL